MTGPASATAEQQATVTAKLDLRDKAHKEASRSSELPSPATMHGQVSVHFQSKCDVPVDLEMESDIASEENLEYFAEHAVSWCKRRP